MLPQREPDRQGRFGDKFFFFSPHPVSFSFFSSPPPFFFPELVSLAIGLSSHILVVVRQIRERGRRGEAMPRPNFRHSKTRAGYIGASVVLGKGVAFDLRAGSSAPLWIVSASFTPDSIPLLTRPLPLPSPSRVTPSRARHRISSLLQI